MKGQFRATKLFSLILLSTAGIVLTVPGASEPLALSLLPVPFLLALLVGNTIGILPLAVGLGMFVHRTWARKFALYYSIGLMADGAVHLGIWFWTGGMFGPPWGFLAVVRILEGLYLSTLALSALKEW